MLRRSKQNYTEYLLEFSNNKHSRCRWVRQSWYPDRFWPDSWTRTDKFRTPIRSRNRESRFLHESSGVVHSSNQRKRFRKLPSRSRHLERKPLAMRWPGECQLPPWTCTNLRWGHSDLEGTWAGRSSKARRRWEVQSRRFDANVQSKVCTRCTDLNSIFVRPKYFDQISCSLKYHLKKYWFILLNYLRNSGIENENVELILFTSYSIDISQFRVS